MEIDFDSPVRYPQVLKVPNSTASMLDPHITPGIIALAVTLSYLIAKLVRSPKHNRLPWWGWAGLSIILSAEFMIFRQAYWVSIYFTPLVWTGYVLLVDALVASLKADSLLSHTPWRFFTLAFWSAPLWLVFEAYNLRLENWEYVGLPDSLALRGLGYAWSFATIWPAIFETAAFIEALGIFKRTDRAARPPRAETLWVPAICGLACVVIPVVVPTSIGRYLFGAVWVGFALLLDPLNELWNGYSFLRDLRAGQAASFWSFLASGWVCGILWEFWNYWAGAKWVYIFPLGQGWKVFEMPIAGYLGFLPFALECKVMFEFLRTLKTRFGPERRIVSWDPAKAHTT